MKPKKVKVARKIEVICGLCEGSGQCGQWIYSDDGTGISEKWQVKDCENCKGKGTIEADVIDQRVVTKKKPMLLPRRC